MAAKPSKAEKTAALKSIIRDLHDGLSLLSAKRRFEQEIGDVSPSEIVELEQALVEDGMRPEEIQQFCNTHALLLQSALGTSPLEYTPPSHPIALFQAENAEIKKRLDDIRETAADEALERSDDLKIKLMAQLLDLKGIETHYERKESVLLPHMERIGFVGPSKVMWGKDDDVRTLLKSALDVLQRVGKSVSAQSYVAYTLDPLLEEIEGMIFKEENILFPAAMEKLGSGHWPEILRESEEVGYAFIKKPVEAEELVRQLEVSQDLTHPRSLERGKRLLEESD